MLTYNSVIVLQSDNTMANPLLGVRVPGDDLAGFRELCKRYNLEASDAVKMFIADCLREGALPDAIANPNPDIISLHDRVARLEAALNSLGKLNRSHQPSYLVR